MLENFGRNGDLFEKWFYCSPLVERDFFNSHMGVSETRIDDATWGEWGGRNYHTAKGDLTFLSSFFF